MNAKKVVHYSHGDLLHDTAIYVMERAVLDEGHRLIEDRRWFEDKHYHSGIPDVYYLHEENGTDTKGRRVDTSLKYCVEIETNPTSDSIIKKYKQFEESCVGHRVIIVPLMKCKDPWNIDVLYSFLKRYVM